MIFLPELRQYLKKNNMKKSLLLLAMCFWAIQSIAQILPPSPPTIVTGAQLGLSNTLRLTWTAPSPTPSGYKITYTEGSVTKTKVVGAVTVDTLKSLNLATSYNISIKSFRLETLPPPDSTFSSATSPITVQMIQLVAPSITIENQNITPTSAIVRINDSNVSETGFELEFTGGGETLKKDLGAGSVFVNTFTGLKPKTTYSVRLRAKKDTEFGPWSPSVTITTPKDVPPTANLKLTKDCPTFVSLEWTFSSRTEDIDEIFIERSFDNNTFNKIGRTDASGRSFFDSEAIPGKTIWYKVTAVNTTGTSTSNIPSVTTKVYVAPNAPFNLKSDPVNKSRNHLTLTWSNGTEDKDCGTNIRDENVIMIKLANESFYRQYRRIYPFETSIKIEGLNPKDIVDMGIIAVSDKGLASGIVSVRDTTAGPPYKPENLIFLTNKDALGNSFFELQWQDKSNDEDYFIIQRSTDNVNFREIGKIKFNNTKFKDLNIEEGVQYYYRVKAGSNTEGDSGFSNVVFGIFDYSAIPNAPYGLLAKANGTKVTLTWYDDSSREQSFKLEKSSDNGVTYSAVATLNRNVITYLDENVLAAKTYLYRIKAINIVGESKNSNIATVTIAGTVGGLLQSEVSVYPNPTFEYIKIKTSESLDNSEVTIQIFDKNNYLVYDGKRTLKANEPLDIDFSKLSQGMYNVIISNSTEKTSRKVFKY